MDGASGLEGSVDCSNAAFFSRRFSFKVLLFFCFSCFFFSFGGASASSSGLSSWDIFCRFSLCSLLLALTTFGFPSITSS